MSSRKYELRKRAEQQEETRRRIVEATVDLHVTVGPAATRITEIARQAGVQRRTVYNHFPDDRALFAACSAHWRDLHPAPDPAAWERIDDRGERLRRALADLYAWYRETEPMLGNVLRDAPLLPALDAVVAPGLGAYLERVGAIVAGGRGRTRRAAAAVAVDFHTWQTLAPLGDRAAAELAARFVEVAA